MDEAEEFSASLFEGKAEGQTGRSRFAADEARGDDGDRQMFAVVFNLKLVRITDGQ